MTANTMTKKGPPTLGDILLGWLLVTGAFVVAMGLSLGLFWLCMRLVVIVFGPIQ